MAIGTERRRVRRRIRTSIREAVHVVHFKERSAVGTREVRVHGSDYAAASIDGVRRLLNAA